MIHFAAFDPDGRIVRVGRCQPEALAGWASQHHGAIAVATGISPETHYIDPATHEPVAYGPAALAALSSPPHPRAVWQPAAGIWVDGRSLDDLRADRWEAIKRDRQAALDAGFVWDGSRFDSDPEARTNISDGVLLAQTLMGMGLPADREWTLADNSTRSLSGEDVVSVGIAMGMHIDAAHTRARLLRAQLFAEATDTPEKIEAISW